jgi:microcompartment protein CcmK/EutM
MFLGKVVGTVWSTKKAPDLEGVKFLIVHPIELDKEPNRSIIVVADRLGAGVGEGRVVRLRQGGALGHRRSGDVY